MNDGVTKKLDGRWLELAASYAGFLCILILLGHWVPMTFWQKRHLLHMLRLPDLAVIGMAVALGATGIALRVASNWGRLAFVVLAPIGSLVVGSVLPGLLWKEDVPYTVLAIFLYAPLVFLLSRRSTLRAVGATGDGWFARGGWLALICTALAGLAFMQVEQESPGSTWDDINELVKREVVCAVLLANYVGALLAATIPPRLKFWQKVAL